MVFIPQRIWYALPVWSTICFLLLKESVSFTRLLTFTNQHRVVQNDVSSTRVVQPNFQLFSTASDTNAPTVPPPNFDGKLIFPMRALTYGLKGHTVAAVYAVMNKSFKRGSDGSWNTCEFIGVTRNLDETLQSLMEEHGAEKMAHVRAMSYPYPQRTAMEELANKWMALSKEADGNADVVLMDSDGWEEETEEDNVVSFGKYLYFAFL